MKQVLLTALLLAMALCSLAQSDQKPKKIFIDVHNFEPGKVTPADVAAAHQKDLATEGKYGVEFLRYWVDEEHGKIYCVSTAADPDDVKKTHAEAHGMVFQDIAEVKPGQQDPAMDGKTFYLDVHELGAGNVTADPVAEAHKKDLLIQAKQGVNFINYWVDEKNGKVYCLSQGPSAEAVTATHKNSHGLVPKTISPVTQGQ